jgi:extracellular factor (EF) 3-hydroxypalmitic acid methyl ester biosynthesis protein
MLDAEARLSVMLDDAHDAIVHCHDVDKGMTRLVEGLWDLRASCPLPTWKSLQPAALGHPLRDVLHSDPFTRWGFEKPRGYPGDAVLLDYTYGHGSFVEQTIAQAPLVGKRVHEWLMTYSGAAGIRDRRRLLAGIIDETAAAKPQPHILAIACGQLRETVLSHAVQEGRIGRFVAMDQDEESLKEVRLNHPDGKIEAVCCSVKDLLTQPREWGGFDFVYAAGLYDYLPPPIAEALAVLTFGMVKSGGKLLISNAIDTVKDAGYMELFMDWWLVYRNAQEVASLVSRLPAEDVLRIRQWDTPYFVYLDVVKR